MFPIPWPDVHSQSERFRAEWGDGFVATAPCRPWLQCLARRDPRRLRRHRIGPNHELPSRFASHAPPRSMSDSGKAPETELAADGLDLRGRARRHDSVAQARRPAAWTTRPAASAELPSVHRSMGGARPRGPRLPERERRRVRLWRRSGGRRLLPGRPHAVLGRMRGSQHQLVALRVVQQRVQSRSDLQRLAVRLPRGFAALRRHVCGSGY
jgi:hypothetical protein